MCCFDITLGQKKVEGVNDKVEIVEAVTELFRKGCKGIVKMEQGGRSVVAYESGSDMGGIYIYLVQL